MFKLINWAAFIVVFATLFTAPASAFTCPSADLTCPAFQYGVTPTTPQWNNWFASKQDALGYTPAKTPAASSKTVASPTAPASTSAYAMQGLAASITPAYSGSVLVTISGTITSSTATAGDGIQYQVSYGTGTAPANAAALTGTQVGSIQEYTNPVAVTAADVHVPFSTTVLITGLTVGTTYWVDLAAESVATASSGGLSNVSVTIAEQ